MKSQLRHRYRQYIHSYELDACRRNKREREQAERDKRMCVIVAIVVFVAWVAICGIAYLIGG